MKIGAIIQARMTSRRLPGKVLGGICGKPMLQYLLERIRCCTSVDESVVATSSGSSDLPIVNFCKKAAVACYRGDLNDVAGRFKGIVLKYQLDGFVRITADSPLIDWRVIDKAVGIFRRGRFEIVTNVLKRTYPAGQSVEVLNSGIFLKGYSKMRSPQDLEHVTKYFYNNHKNYRICNLTMEKDNSDIQLSVDMPEDVNVISSIIKCMDKPHWQYEIDEILKIHRKVSASGGKTLMRTKKELWQAKTTV